LQEKRGAKGPKMLLLQKRNVTVGLKKGGGGAGTHRSLPASCRKRRSFNEKRASEKRGLFSPKKKKSLVGGKTPFSHRKGGEYPAPIDGRRKKNIRVNFWWDLEHGGGGKKPPHDGGKEEPTA